MTSYPYSQPPSYNHQGHYQLDHPWVVIADDPCDCCGDPYHVLDDCPVFYKKLEAHRRREDEKILYSRPSPHQYEEENWNYYDEMDFGYNNYEREMVKDYGYQGEYNINYNENSQEDATLDKIMELLIEMKKDNEEMKKNFEQIKKEDEARNRRHDELVNQVCQLPEDMAQLKQEREDSANDILTSDNFIEEVVDLKNHKAVPLNSSEDSTPLEFELEIIVEEPPIEVIQVCPNHSSEPNIVIDKCGEDGSSGKWRNASLQDLGLTIIKWPQNHATNGSIASYKMWTNHINYRSFIGNSVGKCGSLLSKMGPIGNWNMQGSPGAYLANYRAYEGNTVGKCALRPP